MIRHSTLSLVKKMMERKYVLRWTPIPHVVEKPKVESNDSNSSRRGKHRGVLARMLGGGIYPVTSSDDCCRKYEFRFQ